MFFTVTLTKYYMCYEGMDAQVAYGFHHLRNEKPYLAQGPISNKVRSFFHFLTLVLIHGMHEILI